MYRRIVAALAAWLPFALVASLLWPVLEVDSAPMLAPTPEFVADSHYAAGLEAKAEKRFAAAVESFRRAVEDRPDFPEAWNELGFVFRQTGRYQDALKAYDQALKLRPNFPEALEYLGEAYAKLGRLDDARAILERPPAAGCRARPGTGRGHPGGPIRDECAVSAPRRANGHFRVALVTSPNRSRP
jgi:tetratricopeptide (TPR) repeat protein